MIKQAIQKVDQMFKRANYETMNFVSMGAKKPKFCFDLLAKKGDNFYCIKIFSNIDNLNEKIIKEIKALSTLLKSIPILIGLKNRYEILKDNAIYVRDDLPFITMNTLDNIIQNNLFPHILARRGGGVVFLDGKLMKTLREEKNISRKELSEELNVTKRTICAYENESMRPSEKVAQKIIGLLENASLFRKINVLEWNIKFTINKDELFGSEHHSEFENYLYGVLKDIGLSSYWYKQGVVPFKLTLFSSNEVAGKNQVYPIFSSTSEEDQKINAIQLEALAKFSKILAKKAILIVDNTIRIPDVLLRNKIPVIRIKSLEKLDGEDEFIEFIQEK
ncbi:MAG: helix-turn-helix domain-containing protein [Promethearchaeota archaeon]